jgi:DNA (cytosine-5)-methyltransferase 1
MLTFGSLFAGIRGIDEGLRRCGLAQLYAAELDPKCNRVGQKHFPGERTYEDVATVCGPGLRPDVLTAGWPCQGNSVAGRRSGMADERSGLWHEVARILAEQRPQWFLGENVPGILSVNNGRDWLTVLRDLASLGYGFAYRILDSQWFGVPQRRRRVFLVGHLGDWRRAAEVLFERESLPWDPAPSRETGASVAQTISPSVTGRSDSSGGNNGGLSAFGGNNTSGEIDVATAVNASPTASGRMDFESETFVTLTGEGHDASEDGAGRGTPIVQNCGQGVRRLTPTECCRLQGFPDDWLEDLGLSDSAKYRMLGNSVTVSVLEWIGTRLLRNHEDAAHT